MSPPILTDFKRIVIKVGSSLLVDSAAGRVKRSWLVALAEDIAKLHGDKRDVLVVSSGSIALGRARLKLPRGWSYAARVLDAEMQLTAKGEAFLIQDELQNSYQRRN